MLRHSSASSDRESSVLKVCLMNSAGVEPSSWLARGPTLRALLLYVDSCSSSASAIAASGVKAAPSAISCASSSGARRSLQDRG